jgi:uncharacterized protein (DUF1778 family)
MSAGIATDACLNVQLPIECKQVIEQAAAHLGQTVSEFAVGALVRSAHEVIEQHERTVLTNRDRDTFLEILNNLNAEPNEALQAAAENYKRYVS